MDAPGREHKLMDMLRKEALLLAGVLAKLGVALLVMESLMRLMSGLPAWQPPAAPGITASVPAATQAFATTPRDPAAPASAH